MVSNMLRLCPALAAGPGWWSRATWRPANPRRGRTERSTTVMALTPTLSHYAGEGEKRSGKRLEGIPVLFAVAIFLLLAVPGWCDELPSNRKDFRVCADPNNLPFSNQQQQGFENKIAELVARELG